MFRQGLAAQIVTLALVLTPATLATAHPCDPSGSSVLGAALETGGAQVAHSPGPGQGEFGPSMDPDG